MAAPRHKKQTWWTPPLLWLTALIELPGYRSGPCIHVNPADFLFRRQFRTQSLCWPRQVGCTGKRRELTKTITPATHRRAPQMLSWGLISTCLLGKDLKGLEITVPAHTQGQKQCYWPGGGSKRLKIHRERGRVHRRPVAQEWGASSYTEHRCRSYLTN